MSAPSLLVDNVIDRITDEGFLNYKNHSLNLAIIIKTKKNCPHLKANRYMAGQFYYYK